MRLFTVRVFSSFAHVFFIYCFRSCLWGVNLCRFFMTSWFGSLISNYFTLDWFFRISTYKPQTVETFHRSCIFPLLHTFFSYFRLFFHISTFFSYFHFFFIFPPTFSYIASDHVYKELTYVERFMTSQSLIFKNFNLLTSHYWKFLTQDSYFPSLRIFFFHIWALFSSYAHIISYLRSSFLFLSFLYIASDHVYEE